MGHAPTELPLRGATLLLGQRFFSRHDAAHILATVLASASVWAVKGPVLLAPLFLAALVLGLRHVESTVSVSQLPPPKLS
jgi:hypothetical protein